MRSQTLLLADTICKELDDAEELLLKRERQMAKDKFAVPEGVTDLDPSTVEDFRYIFDVFDEDANGFIDRKELVKLFAMLGQSMREKDLHKLMKTVDLNTDGIISWPEFLLMIQALYRAAQNAHQYEPDEQASALKAHIKELTAQSFVEVSGRVHQQFWADVGCVAAQAIRSPAAKDFFVEQLNKVCSIFFFPCTFPDNG
jgi:hypothetical protein